jgi:hypothetical protein
VSVSPGTARPRLLQPKLTSRARGPRPVHHELREERPVQVGLHEHVRWPSRCAYSRS